MTLLFIFDMDEVLYGYDWRIRMAGLTESTGLPLEELRRLWWNERGEWAAEAGAFATPEEYFSAFTAAIGTSIDEHEWVRIRGSAMTPWPDSIAAARRAAELGTVTLLTNNGPLVGRHLPALAPELVEIFGENLYTSSHYGARKPQPVVFERVLAAYETRASDAFFADDLLENVEAARSIGITGHVFTTPSSLLGAIEEFNARHALTP
jgi:HAD superfamily hydrolase (TIGR01509 family)